MSASDATLLEQLASEPSGDSLRALYRRYGGELYGFAFNALGDRGLAEEVVQDTFTSVWRHAAEFDPERGSFRTWLYGVARNRIVDLRRRAAARPRSRMTGPASRTPGALDESLERAALRWQLAAALARLSPEHRQIVRLAHFEQLTMREIAEATDLPLGTVKSRAYYALRHLRLVLDEMGVGSMTRLCPLPRDARRLRAPRARARRGRCPEAHLQSCAELPRRVRGAGGPTGLLETVERRRPAGGATAGAGGGRAGSVRPRAPRTAPPAPARAAAPAARARGRRRDGRGGSGRARARRGSSTPAPRKRRSERCTSQDGAASGATANAELHAVRAGTGVSLRVSGLPPVHGQVYEVWCIPDDGRWISGGTFRVDGRGGARVTLTSAARPGDYERILVTRRPERGRRGGEAPGCSPAESSTERRTERGARAYHQRQSRSPGRGRPRRTA